MSISNKITIPAWISTKVYEDFDNSVIAFAINEITKELLIFEDLPAKIWNLISRGTSVSDIYSFAKDNDADDEIEEFLSSITAFFVGGGVKTTLKALTMLILPLKTVSAIKISEK